MSNKVLVCLPSEGYGGCEKYAERLAGLMSQDGYEVTVAVPSRYPRSKSRLELNRHDVGLVELPSWESLDTLDEAQVRQRIDTYAKFFHSMSVDMIVLVAPWPLRAIPLILACAEVQTRTLAIFQLVQEPLEIPASLSAALRTAHSAAPQSWVCTSTSNRMILAEALDISPPRIAVALNTGSDDPSRVVRRAGRSRLHDGPLSQVVILWGGRFEDQKDPQLAIRVLHQLRRLGVKAQLVMVGDGSLQAESVELAKELDVWHSVAMPGWVDGLQEWFNYADIFLSTSKWEASSLIIAEAMATGCSIVATAIPPTLELLGEELAAITVPVSGELEAARACFGIAVDGRLRADVEAKAYRRSQALRSGFNSYSAAISWMRSGGTLG